MKKQPISLLLGLTSTFLFVGCSSSSISLNGAGATFPNPIYQRWFADFSEASGAKVNYQSVGSGAGIRQFVKGTVDFAATDEPIKAEEADKVARKVVQIPLTAGTIAIAYNNPGCSLNLTQQQLAQIFMGSIKRWEDLGCKGGAVVVVHRADGSGTTAVLTKSLSAFSAEWAAKYGHGKSVNFPVGVAAKGNEGVAGTLKTTPGSIGYVNLSYATQPGIQVAKLQNKAGKFVAPDATSGSSALQQIELNPLTLAGDNPNPDGELSYPLTTLTWFLAYKNGNGSRTETIRSLLSYTLSKEAQGQAKELGYVPLSGPILEMAQKAIGNVAP